MQEDFHYYATYCAAYLAGYNHEEALTIATADQFVDLCSKTLLKKAGAPESAATTQLQGEMVEARTDFIGCQDITRIWSSFHFLPKDLYADVKALSKNYKNKYRLICGPNSDLAEKTVKLAKDKNLESVGISMHVLADTWAHAYFAGTPSQVINNTNYEFYEVLNVDGKEVEKQIHFMHSVSSPDDLENSVYTSSVNNGSETFIMNLGHGRAGHLPDYSFVKYRYLPAWGNYEAITKDNPHDYYEAFCQMVYAMEYLRGKHDDFKKEHYAYEVVEPYKDRINTILRKRQLNACEDWKKFGEELSMETIKPFDVKECYAGFKKGDFDNSFLGRFVLGAIRQKGMVTKNIYESHNNLAGISKDLKVA